MPRLLVIFILGSLNIGQLQGSAAPMKDSSNDVAKLNVGFLGESIAAAGGVSLRQKLDRDAKNAIDAKTKTEIAVKAVVLADKENVVMRDAKPKQENRLFSSIDLKRVTEKRETNERIADRFFPGLKAAPLEILKIILDYDNPTCAQWARGKNAVVGTYVHGNLFHLVKMVSVYNEPSILCLRESGGPNTEMFSKIDLKEMTALDSDQELDGTFTIPDFHYNPRAHLIMYPDRNTDIRLRDSRTLEEIKKIELHLEEESERGPEEEDNFYCDVDRIESSRYGERLCVSISKNDWYTSPYGGLNHDLAYDIRIYDIKTGNKIAERKDIRFGCFLRDSDRIVAFSQDNKIIVCDVNNLGDIYTVPLEISADTINEYQNIELSPDQTCILLSHRHASFRYSSFLINIKTGKTIREIPQFEGASFSPDGTMIIGFGAEKNLRCYRVADGSEIEVLGLKMLGNNAQFLSDGSSIAVANNETFTLHSLAGSSVLTAEQTLFVKMLEENRATGKPNDLSNLAKQYGISELRLFETFDNFSFDSKKTLTKLYGFTADAWGLYAGLIDLINAFMQVNEKSAGKDRISRISAALKYICCDGPHKDEMIFNMFSNKINDHLEEKCQTIGMNNIADGGLHRKRRLLGAVINKEFAK